MKQPNTAFSIDNANGKHEVCALWRERFAGPQSDDDSGYESAEDLFFEKSGSFHFTPKNVLDAIRSTPGDKAYDNSSCGMSPRLYQSTVVAECLSVAFNHLCTRERTQPKPGRTFRFYLRPTLKDQQKAKSISKSYRPLSISGLTLVFYERVLTEEMADGIETLLPKLSFAYRKKRGTSMPILKLKQLLQRKGTIAVFLDASDAFGCINWRIMFKMLRDKGFDSNLIAAINRLYVNSGGRVVWQGVSSEWFKLTKGVRQGGSISGHLFNLYFSMLDVGLGRVEILFYADDLVVIATHPWALTSFLHDLQRVSRQLHVQWNPSKCKVLQMSSTYKHTFWLLGKPLENVNRFVYLGWIIVRKLKNCDDEQAMRQAGRFYAAAHEICQSYDFAKRLPLNERINLAKCFGSLYAPEAFTSVSDRAFSKLRAAHRYLYMKVTGWNGIEVVEAGSSNRSQSIHSEDSDEEYYDTRSRWLYAHAATIPKETQHTHIRGMQPNGQLVVEHLRPAPCPQFQLRKAQWRMQRVLGSLDVPLDLSKNRLSKNIVRVLAPG